jgi:RluA family pseudouridine synthase
VHRHEPPVSNDPVLVLHVDKEREFVVVSKPGSLPVHAAGRYFQHTLLEILKRDHGINAYAVNRLDRLTSGLMILALSGPASRDLAEEFKEGKVGKEYIARVRGKFPEEQITVDQPLLTVDRQMGLVIVAPQGKESQTVFTRMSYDAERDQSVVHCRPLTGRTHQIRVHLQWLGYPIANDPLYAQSAVWGLNCGKGGVDLAEQNDVEGESHQLQAIKARVAEGAGKTGPRRRQPPPRRGGSPPPIPDDSARMAGIEAAPEEAPTRPLQTATAATAPELANIDVTSPIRLSEQARGVIASLRRQRDAAEDWVKWKEVVWATKKVQDEFEKRAVEGEGEKAGEKDASVNASDSDADADANKKDGKKDRRQSIPHPRVNHGHKRVKAVERQILADHECPLPAPAHVPEGFCTQCFVPVPDDPDPETLFIYLHARRYTTEKLGTWETPLPRWAGEEWDGDWRGWDGEPPVGAAGKAPEAGEVVDVQKLVAATA